MYKLTIHQPEKSYTTLNNQVVFKSDRLDAITGIINLMMDTWREAQTTFTIEEVEPDEEGVEE